MKEYLFPQDTDHDPLRGNGKMVRKGGMTQRAYMATQFMAAHLSYIGPSSDEMRARAIRPDIDGCIMLADMLIKRLKETEGGDA